MYHPCIFQIDYQSSLVEFDWYKNRNKRRLTVEHLWGCPNFSERSNELTRLSCAICESENDASRTIVPKLVPRWRCSSCRFLTSHDPSHCFKFGRNFFFWFWNILLHVNRLWNRLNFDQVHLVSLVLSSPNFFSNMEPGKPTWLKRNRSTLSWYQWITHYGNHSRAFLYLENNLIWSKNRFALVFFGFAFLPFSKFIH